MQVAHTPVWLLDVKIGSGGQLEQPIPKGWNAFIYVLDGVASVDGAAIQRHHIALFGTSGDKVVIGGPSRFILVAGRPLDQGVVQDGLFVETTKQRLKEAHEDFNNYIKRKR